MTRLYQRIYLTIIASLLVVVLVAGAVWRFRPEDSPASPAVALAGDLAAASLPPADAPREVQQQAIQRLAERLNADLALFDSAQRPIAAAGNPLPPPSHWQGMEGGGGNTASIFICRISAG